MKPENCWKHKDFQRFLGMAEPPAEVGFPVRRRLAGTRGPRLRKKARAQLAKTAFLWTGVSLIPHRCSSPDPSCPLQCIGNRWILAPVNEQADRSTFLAGFPHIIEPLSHPVCPGSLVFIISIEIRKCIRSTHTAVFLVCSTISFILLCSTGRIRWIGNDWCGRDRWWARCSG